MLPTISWLWLAAAVIFLIAEIFFSGFYFACFFVGAIASAILGIFKPEWYLMQAGTLAVVAIILMPLTRPLARKITRESPRKTNVDAMIGETGYVTKLIDPELGAGQVTVDGQPWQAVASEQIQAGTKIVVEKVIGARLHVSKYTTGDTEVRKEG